LLFDKKSNVIRGFMGLSVTILGMLFAALWFTIQDQDQKAIMQMMIAINKSDAEQTLKVFQKIMFLLSKQPQPLLLRLA
jgi:mannitol/fructose-specific phosphotransferase system IIA component (Ntr-type)